MCTLTATLSGLLCALAVSAAETPRPSPELTMQRGVAAPVRLSQFRGKIVALAFTHLTCSHCQDLTRVLNVIQKDYAGRNVQVVECAFDPDAATLLSEFNKAFQPNFPVGYATDTAVRKYLNWSDAAGPLYVPYMIFIDSQGTITGDYSGSDGFFNQPDVRVRAVLDKMLKPAAPPAGKK